MPEHDRWWRFVFVSAGVTFTYHESSADEDEDEQNRGRLAPVGAVPYGPALPLHGEGGVQV